MYAKYEANLNIDGTGAIVAAPDLETPGERNISLENDCELAGTTMYVLLQVEILRTLVE